MSWLWTLLGGVALGLITNELFDWCAWLAERLLRRAARFLPAALQQRYLDEWLGDLDTIPGKLAKLAWAGKRLFEAPDLGWELGGLPRGRALLLLRRGIDLFVATAGLIGLGPLLLAAILAVRLAGGPGPILTRRPYLRPDGKVFHMLELRTRSTKRNASRPSRVGLILERCRLVKLPRILNLLRGDLSLLGRIPEQLAPRRARIGYHARLAQLNVAIRNAAVQHLTIRAIREFDALLLQATQLEVPPSLSGPILETYAEEVRRALGRFYSD